MSVQQRATRHARPDGGEPTIARWRRWRQSRPLAAGTLVIGAGSCLLLLPAGTFAVVLLPGIAGTSGFLFGAGLVVLGLFLVLQPRSHAFAGTAAMLVAITSLVTTNLGGFGLGLTLGVVGGAWGFAWTTERDQPGTSTRPRPAPERGHDGRPPASSPADNATRPIPLARHDPTIRR